MFCPKCGATLKDGAKFCHACGVTIGDTPVNPQAQQPYQQQQQQPYQQQPQQSFSGQGFDFSKIPTKVWIVAGVAFLGVICTFLPWITVSSVASAFFGEIGGSYSVSASGLSSGFGILTMLCFLVIAAGTIFWQAIGLNEKVKDQIMMFTGFGAAAFCLIDLIRFLAQSAPYSSVRPGFGLIIAILVAVALILFNLKVIKLK